jgi:hypothetical protein
MLSTEAWARSLDIATELLPPAIEGYNKRWPRSARQVAVRTIILQGVVSVAAGVDPGPVVEWFRKQRLWRSVTPEERAFLTATAPAEEDCRRLGWHAEAEWALLWAIGKVEALGLPTHLCDSRRICREIMPALGSDVTGFIASAQMRPPGLLLAEDDRTYDLWCYAQGARRKCKPLPDDLDLSVLYERRYAFEWLDGADKWDNVTCDA